MWYSIYTNLEKKQESIPNLYNSSLFTMNKRNRGLQLHNLHKQFAREKNMPDSLIAWIREGEATITRGSDKKRIHSII